MTISTTAWNFDATFQTLAKQTRLFKFGLAISLSARKTPDSKQLYSTKKCQCVTFSSWLTICVTTYFETKFFIYKRNMLDIYKSPFYRRNTVWVTLYCRLSLIVRDQHPGVGSVLLEKAQREMLLCVHACVREREREGERTNERERERGGGGRKV